MLKLLVGHQEEHMAYKNWLMQWGVALFTEQHAHGGADAIMVAIDHLCFINT